jgi:hypothetical protein
LIALEATCSSEAAHRTPSLHVHTHRNIDCLEGFRELNTLILDNNHLTHDTKFPPMPKLRTLSINHNWYVFLPCRTRIQFSTKSSPSAPG